MVPSAVAAGRIQELLDARSRANAAFFAAESERLARVCHAMAERFARGGRLVAFGRSPAARSDARHVAVEFVHPVIVGKRALPALGLAGEGGPLDTQAALLLAGDDIALGFEASDPECAAALQVASERGCLTLGFAAGCGAEHEFIPPSDDPAIRQELVETLYHVLWELVHVFFEHRGLLSGRTERTRHDAGASSFLYPFLDEREDRLEPVLADVARSVVMKSDEVGLLRAQTLGENEPGLVAAAEALRDVFAGGGKLLALGNGGSATDAMDAVADFRSAAGGSAAGGSATGGSATGGSAAHPAVDLTEDPGIITAIANDIGVEAIFLRQVIAYGNAGDALLALSTSGNSGNVIAALGEARKRGLVTMAMVGYDGGRVAAEGLADHVIVTRSEHIPRIQEAQASAYHVLRELVG